MATSITNTSVTTDNLTVDTDTIHVDSANNRVGIGTTTPARTLSVESTGSGGTNRIATLKHTDGTYAFVTFSDTNTTDDGQVRIGALTNDLLAFAGGSERMRIDSSGRVTTPNQPSFLMKKYSGGSTAISNNTAWIYDEALTNVGGHANISNGRFTAPVAGNYCFMWHNIGEGTSTVYRSFIRKNASASWGTGSYRLESRNYHSAGYPNASAQVVVPLSASDYVDIYVSGGSLYSDTTNGVWFCGFLIG